MSTALPQNRKTAYLIFGVVDSLAAVLWCVGGQGFMARPWPFWVAWS
jgi:hypothetical protein